MITKKEYKKISSKWKGHKYQTWDKVSTRLELLDKIAADLIGAYVLEPGCNAGIVGYAVSRLASRYIGIEDDKTFYRQALKTAKFIDQKKCKATFYNRTLGKFLHRHDNHKFDIVYTSNVLYYLRESELKLLREKVFPSCSMMINIFRARKKKAGRNKHKFYNCENIAKYFNEFKFKIYKGSIKELYMMVGTK